MLMVYLISVACGMALAGWMCFRLGVAIEAERRYRADHEMATHLRWRIRNPQINPEQSARMQ